MSIDSRGYRRIGTYSTANRLYQHACAIPPRIASPPNRSFSSGQQPTTVDGPGTSAEPRAEGGGHERAMADQPQQPALLERIPLRDEDRPSASDVAAPPAATFPPSPVQAPQASTSHLMTPATTALPSMVRTRSGLGTVDAQVYGVVCVGFDHALGPNIEFAYPDALADNHDLNKNLPFLALPDGAHAVRFLSSGLGAPKKNTIDPRPHPCAARRGLLVLPFVGPDSGTRPHHLWHLVQPPDPRGPTLAQGQRSHPQHRPESHRHPRFKGASSRAFGKF